MAGKYYRLRPSLPDETWSRLAEADRLILFSLSPESHFDGDGQECLRGYPILRQVEVVGARIADIHASLRAGEEEGTLGARCFDPRHGLRALRGETVLDLVICFECTNMAVYGAADDLVPVMADMSASPKALLDDLLGLPRPEPASPAEPAEYESWGDVWSEDGEAQPD